MNSITYVLYSDEINYCVLVDCGEWDTLKPVLNRIDKTVRCVLLTHGHSDHIYGLEGLLRSYPKAQICTNIDGHAELKDAKKNLSLFYGFPFAIEAYTPILLEDKQILHFEGLADIEVIATPGHDTSCLSFKVNNHLFTGDAYIPGVKIFTKFPRGNKAQALQSIALLSDMEKQGFTIHCGHHSYC